MDPRNPEAVLAQAEAAAKAAAELLPALERECDDLQHRLKTKQEQAARLRALAERFGFAVSGVANVVQPAAPVPLSPVSAAPDLEWAMRKVGPLSATEMITLIEGSLGRKWAISTVFNQLKKGKDSGRYINEDGKWMLSDNRQGELA